MAQCGGSDQAEIPKLATLMDDAENDVLAYMTFPKQHWAKLHSTNPIERLNGEIKPRTEVVDIFPNEDAIIRLVGALLLEQNDEWAVQRSRYMTLETIAQMSDDPRISLPAVARGYLIRPKPESIVDGKSYTTLRDTIEGIEGCVEPLRFVNSTYQRRQLRELQGLHM